MENNNQENFNTEEKISSKNQTLMNKKINNKIIYSILVIALMVIISMIFNLNKKIPEIETVTKENNSLDTNKVEPIKEEFYSYSYDYNKEITITSPEKIEYKVPKLITDFDYHINAVISNPTDNNSVIISTNNNNYGPAEKGTCTTKLYTYNLKKHELLEFYSNNDKNCFGLYIMGTQKSKLIFLNRSFEYGIPPECNNPWFYYSKNMKFVFLDLLNIEAGLKEFIVPEYKTNISEEDKYYCL